MEQLNNPVEETIEETIVEEPTMQDLEAQWETKKQELEDTADKEYQSQDLNEEYEEIELEW